MREIIEYEIIETLEYFNKHFNEHPKYKLERKGTPFKVRVVALYHDSMENGYYTWHDY